MKRTLFWPTMHADITEFVQGCVACQRCKHGKPSKQGHMMSICPQIPFSLVSMDIYGPLPVTSGTKMRYVLSIMDQFTRWVVLVPLQKIDAETVAQAFVDHWLSFYGTPDLLVMDSGSNFKSSFFTELNRLLGVEVHAFPAMSQ